MHKIIEISKFYILKQNMRLSCHFVFIRARILNSCVIITVSQICKNQTNISSYYTDRILIVIREFDSAHISLFLIFIFFQLLSCNLTLLPQIYISMLLLLQSNPRTFLHNLCPCLLSYEDKLRNQILDLRITLFYNAKKKEILGNRISYF